ncbi:hypothetical protein A2115_01530 [Candidatus Woesebacteria bacterium GWA1_41_8]|uniref:Methyltransferase type 11 domain-containing protein n=1 Tax=Candidatus Woesebacteria bacterium GWA1_41_8 TaxID=1802471 RepID=A0A1F7WH66_9BACT|nr:MAG: hypothetical protein A2115_01530 [Candidatus Woesebacteria bacterium GWA1_41_8]
MRKFTSKIVRKIVVHTPQRIRNLLKFLGFPKFVNYFLTKEDGELIAQESWVNFFKSNKDLYLKNWEEYFFLRKIIELARIHKKSRILDVGCGVSTVLHFVEGKKWGIDPLAETYKKLYPYPKDIIIKKAVGEKIAFSRGFFDVVFCTNSLDHTDNPAKTLSEIYRVLKPGAFFVLHVDIFKKKAKRDKTHPFCFTQKDCIRLLGNKFDILFKAKTNKSIFGKARDRAYFIAVAQKVNKLK